MRSDFSSNKPTALHIFAGYATFPEALQRDGSIWHTGYGSIRRRSQQYMRWRRNDGLLANYIANLWSFTRSSEKTDITPLKLMLCISWQLDGRARQWNQPRQIRVLRRICRTHRTVKPTWTQVQYLPHFELSYSISICSPIHRAETVVSGHIR